MKLFSATLAFLLLSPTFARSHVSPRFASVYPSVIRREFVPPRRGAGGREPPAPVEEGTGSQAHHDASPLEAARQQPKFETITIERLTEAPTPGNPKAGIFLNEDQRRWEIHFGPEHPNLRKAEVAWQRMVNSFLAHDDFVGVATRPYLRSDKSTRVAQRWDITKTYQEQWSDADPAKDGAKRRIDLATRSITHVDITPAERSWYDLAMVNLFIMKGENRAQSGWATHLIVDYGKSGNTKAKLRKRESSSVVAQLVPRPNEPDGGTNYGPPKSATGGNQSDTPGFQIFNVVDPNNSPQLPKQKMRSRKRGNPVTTIITQEGNSQNNNQNSTADQQAQFELYLDAFYTAQGNITDAIWPFLNEITNGSNSSVVYDIAWSVWADLTAPNEYVAGPFRNGMHCLDSIEDDYAKANNLTNTSSEYMAMLAMDKVLIDLYDYAWTSGIKAANASGLLKDFAIIESNLQAKDLSIPPATFSQVGTANDDSYFTTYNETMVPGS